MVPLQRVVHVGPAPPPVDSGIAATLDGMMRSNLAQQFELLPFDVRVPPWAQNHRLLRPVASGQFLRRFVGMLRSLSPAMVHVHSSAYMSFWEKAVMGRLASMQRIPWILHMHDGFFEDFLPSLNEPLATVARSQLRRATAVICPCRAWRSWLADWLPEERLHVVANGIDFEAFEAKIPATSQDVRLLFMGHLTMEKGLADLAQALAALRPEERQRFQLELIGTPFYATQEKRIHQVFSSAGIAERVHFLGNLYGADKRAAMQRADIFVLPSHRESFCIANLEAMASGLPVISTRTGAIPEVVRDGVDGLLVPPRDVGALSVALETLMHDAQKRQSMGTAARQRARRFDWSIISEELSTIYKGVLGA